MTPEQLAAINSRIADYRGRHARGEVTTLAHDIALIDAPLLIAALAAARRDAAACEARLQDALATRYYVDWEWVSHFDPDEPDLECEPGYKLFHVYESKPMRMGTPVAHYRDEAEANADADTRNAALAATPPAAPPPAEDAGEVAQLRAALAWYADEQSYDDHGHWVDRRASAPEWLSMVPIEQDRGNRARAALGAARERSEPMPDAGGE
jgi:hypothetical protein